MKYIITPTFIDSFKIGDNINYNILILNKLYETYSLNPIENKILLKPIIVTNATITEAILYDFIHNRVQHANFTEKILLHVPEIFSVKLSKFNHYITQSRKHNLFDGNDNFYNALEILAKKRNRLHIQNEKFEVPRDEIEVFDERTKILSEKILEKICNVLSKKYPRRSEYVGYVADFIFPWNRHFETQ